MRIIPTLIHFIAFVLPFEAFSYVLETDIVYDTVQGDDLKLDVYKPENPKPNQPALIYIHGGCWNSGSKSSIPSYITDLTKDGFTVISVGYRFSQKAVYPAALTDVGQALRYVRKNSEKLNIDPKKIATHGESAGGYLAAALGVRTSKDRTGKEDAYSERVPFVSDWYGRTDFTRSQPNNLDCALSFLGKPRDASTMKDFKEASILPYVDEKSAEFVIVHGTHDVNVSPIHSTLLEHELKKYNKKVDLHLVEGAGHAFFGGKSWAFTKNKLLNYFYHSQVLSVQNENL